MFFTALFDLESDWRNIVDGLEHLTEKQQQQQTALWELAQTEAAYIKTLRVVTNVSESPSISFISFLFQYGFDCF